MQQLDPSTPYGHTAANARHEGRIIVRVTMREDQMSQMLPDGRGYSGPGPHEIQIYKSDLRHLEALFEPATPAELAMVAARVEQRTAAWCAETKRSRAECPISFPAEYRLVFLRDLNPVTKIEIVGEMDTIQLEAERKRAAAITDATGASAAAQNASLATTVATAVAAEMAKVMRGNDKGGR